MAAHAQGTPSWVEAQLPDIEAGRRFYGGLFGWSFDTERHEALLGGRRVAGIIPKRDGRMPTTWTLYLAATDAGTVAARVKAAGGRMVMEPYPVGPFGVRALASDPGGAVFGVRQAGDENGFAVTGEPGTFCWVEVHTREPDAVDTFYAAVFGWLGHPQGGPAAPSPTAEYRLRSPPGTRDPGADTAFGGRAVMPAAVPAAFPGHLLVHFAARDCDETCDAATRLGARVVLAPRDTPHGRTAVLDDDQGARFAILTRPPR
ncbi:VOC family protein [Streptomyces laurentii]|uniref:VOC family protein n=1 Tax=Streptomyces laurentii TaxID=39478 RepID=UPI0036C4674F